MDAAGIQTKVARGYGIAARFLGSTYTQYRPTGPNAALTNVVQTLNAAFDTTAGFKFAGPALWGKPTRFGLFDTTNVQVGDYFVGQAQTLFVSAFQLYEPPELVLCNAVMSISSPGEDTLPGLSNTYAGRTNATDQVLATGWPVSILIKQKGDMDPVKLPADVRSASFEVLMPIIPGVAITPSLRLNDGQGNTYVVNAAEQTSFGNRLLASFSTT
nr:hypothetical protein [uncultured Lichenicoccus sp.]